MAKKKEMDELIFCDRCKGSLPKGTRPFRVELPDGTVLMLCQECAWAARSEEEQPSLKLDDDIEVDEKALQSIRRTGGGIVEEEAAAGTDREEEVEEEQESIPLAGPVPAAGGFRRCKTFVSQVTPQALNFLDQHIAEFIRERKIRVKHATSAHGMAGIGVQGTRVDAYFVTIWW